MLFIALLFTVLQSDPQPNAEAYLDSVKQWQYVNLDTAEYFVLKALQTNNNQDLLISAKAKNAYGRLKTSSGNYSEGIELHAEALEISRQIKDSLEIAESLNNIGIARDEKGEHREAIASYLLALYIYEDLEDLNGIAKVNNNIAIVYKDMSDLPAASPYYLRALHTYEQLGHALGVASVANNLSTVYNKRAIFDSALLLARQSIRYFEQQEYFQYLPYPQINAGDAFIGMKEFDSAVSYLNSARNTLFENGNSKELADADRSLANALMGKNDYQSAMKLAKEGLSIANNLDLLIYQQNANAQIAELFEIQKSYDSALFYRKELERVKDLIRDETRSNQIASLQAQYESEKKDRELTTAKLQLSEKQNQLLWMAVGAVIVAGSLFFLIFVIRNRQKRVLTRVQIQEQQRSLSSIIEAEENERKRISRELHDGIGQSMSAIIARHKSLANQGINSTDWQELTSLIETSQQEIRHLSHQMMPSTLVEIGLSQAIEQMAGDSLASTSIDLSYVSNLSEGVRFNSKTETTYFRIAQEIVQNAMKHSQATELSINLYKRSDHLILMISDDGIGFDPKQAYEGIGLSNMKARVDTINGQLTIESSSKEGTSITIKSAIT